MINKALVIQRQRVQALLDRLNSGIEVSLRDFKNAISEQDYSDYEIRLAYKQDEKSMAICSHSEYEKLLQLGDFAYNKMEGASTRGRHALAKKYSNQSQSYYEQALISLYSEYTSNPNIQMSYDRNLGGLDKIETAPALCPEEMPRLKSSKSVHNKDRIKLDKKGLKIQTLKSVLNRINEEELNGDRKPLGKQEIAVTAMTESKDKRDELSKDSARLRATINIKSSAMTRLQQLRKQLEEEN